jgi:hypothetical protein
VRSRPADEVEARGLAGGRLGGGRREDVDELDEGEGGVAGRWGSGGC